MNLFYGYIKVHHNSVEAELKKFFSVSYTGLLSSMIKYLVDDNRISQDTYDIKFSNALHFITDGSHDSATVEGKGDEDSLMDFLNDLRNDNLDDGSWFSFYASGEAVVDLEKHYMLSISFNGSFKEEGYETDFKVLCLPRERVNAELKHLIKKLTGTLPVGDSNRNCVDLINNLHSDDVDNFRGGINIRYQVEEPVTGTFIEGDKTLN